MSRRRPTLGVPEPSTAGGCPGALHTSTFSPRTAVYGTADGTHDAAADLGDEHT
jgi:hypothetical protein